ncbi:hypothetical protein DVH05_021137 [Phytophthora capsici]|nr:hypothetical protein DVH05_021137 [Phytophthora capsici]
MHFANRSEKLKAEKYLFTDEEIKPYFPLERVLDGLFSLTSRLFGVEIEAADGQAEIWNPDVRFFNVRSTEGDKEIVARFFLDPYSRPKEKNGGAWMNTCVDRSRLLGPEEQGGKRVPGFLRTTNSGVFQLVLRRRFYTNLRSIAPTYSP